MEYLRVVFDGIDDEQLSLLGHRSRDRPRLITMSVESNERRTPLWMNASTPLLMMKSRIFMPTRSRKPASHQQVWKTHHAATVRSQIREHEKAIRYKLFVHHGDCVAGERLGPRACIRNDSSSNGKPLNNLFGMTEHGGNNIAYPSVEASADAWIADWTSYLAGRPKTIKEYAAALEQQQETHIQRRPRISGRVGEAIPATSRRGRSLRS